MPIGTFTYLMYSIIILECGIYNEDTKGCAQFARDITTQNDGVDYKLACLCRCVVVSVLPILY